MWVYPPRQILPESFGGCRSTKNILIYNGCTVGGFSELFKEVEDGEGDKVVFGSRNTIVPNFLIRVI